MSFARQSNFKCPFFPHFQQVGFESFPTLCALCSDPAPPSFADVAMLAVYACHVASMSAKVASCGNSINLICSLESRRPEMIFNFCNWRGVIRSMSPFTKSCFALNTNSSSFSFCDCLFLRNSKRRKTNGYSVSQTCVRACRAASIVGLFPINLSAEVVNRSIFLK